MITLGGLLVAPNLIDWTPYRAAFAERLFAATGRKVSIDGDVDFVLLPRPAFNANEVRINGAVADDFVAIERLSARLAVFPLLKGEFAFRELVLMRPEARLTRDLEGRIDFLPAFLASERSQASPVPSDSATTPFDWDVERVVIEGGVASLRDSADGAIFTVHGVDLAVGAPQVAPVTIAGNFVVADVPMTLNAVIGRVGGGVNTVSATLGLAEADTAAKFSGTFAPSRDWEVRGDLNIASATAAALMASLDLVDAASLLPQALQGALSLDAKIRGNRSAVFADPLVADIGGTPARGTLNWRAADGNPDASPMIDLTIEVGTVQVEAWRFAEANASIPKSFATRNKFAVVKTAHAQAAAPPLTNVGLLTAFKKTNAKIGVRIPVLSYRGQTLRGGALAASIAEGVLTVSDASVELPAATYVKAAGLVRLEQAPVFEGILDMQTGDLRGMLAWLGFDIDPARRLPGRLSNATLRAGLQGTPARIALGDISATIDTSAITGSMSWAREGGARSTMGLDLAVNALNIDIYAPLFKEPTPEAAVASGGSPPDKPTTYGVTPTFTAFSALADFDAEMRLRIDSVTAGGIANGKVGLDLALKDATLTVRSASFENVGGATAWFSGGIGGFGVSPNFDNLKFDLSTPDLVRVGRAFGFEVPTPLRSLSPVSLTGVVKGGLAQADLTATLKAANLSIRADGQALTLDHQPHLTLKVEASEPSYAALLKAAGAPWPLNLADPGAVKFTAQVTHQRSETKIEALEFRIGEHAITGSLNIARGQGLPEVTGSLSGVALAVDKLWPRESPARQITPRQITPRPVATRPVQGNARGAAIASAWSDESFDWRFLSGWRGTIELSGRSLSLRGIAVRDFSCRIVVADDAAEIVDWNGKVFGAPGQIYLRASALPVPSLQGELAFLGGDLGAVAASVNGGTGGETGGLKSGGKADFAGSFRTQGASPAALVAGLAGSGTVKITTADAGSGVISGLLGAVAAANQLEGLASGSQGGGPVTLESRVSATAGRIKIEDATVASKSYGGAFTGMIDLPGWQVDLAGKLRLESRTPGAAARPETVAITIKGALDLPNIMLLPVSP